MLYWTLELLRRVLGMLLVGASGCIGWSDGWWCHQRKRDQETTPHVVSGHGCSEHFAIYVDL